MSAFNRKGNVPTGGGQRQRDGMIRRDGCAQLTRPHMNWRWTKTKGWDDQKKQLCSIDKATYFLEMGKGEGMR